MKKMYLILIIRNTNTLYIIKYIHIKNKFKKRTKFVQVLNTTTKTVKIIESNVKSTNIILFYKKKW
jgi:hypothetical protein